MHYDMLSVFVCLQDYGVYSVCKSRAWEQCTPQYMFFACYKFVYNVSSILVEGHSLGTYVEFYHIVCDKYNTNAQETHQMTQDSSNLSTWKMDILK